MNDTAARFQDRQAGFLPDLLGLEWIELRPGFAHGRLDLKHHHLAPNGYLHAATVVTLADTACGYGCIVSLPEGAASFTTIELKTNFLGTALEGGIACEARLLHGGRATQVWDAEVKSEVTSKTLALFRCTQFLLAKPAAKSAH
jgi:1,4-dihydroxy-2-naphthoyl-CoA hydrolase